MDTPKTRSEAIERGYTPLTDPDVMARFEKAMRRKPSKDLSFPITEANTCIGKADGTACGTQFIDGKIVQCYCMGQACDPKTALWAPDE